MEVTLRVLDELVIDVALPQDAGRGAPAKGVTKKHKKKEKKGKRSESGVRCALTVAAKPIALASVHLFVTLLFSSSSLLFASKKNSGGGGSRARLVQATGVGLVVLYRCKHRVWGSCFTWG